MTIHLLVPKYICIEEDNSIMDTSEFQHMVAPNHPIVCLLLENPDYDLTESTLRADWLHVTRYRLVRSENQYTLLIRYIRSTLEGTEV